MGIELYNEHNMDGMRRYPDKHFELAIVDVQYGINVCKTGRVGGNQLAAAKNYGAKEWDKKPPNLIYFTQYHTIRGYTK